VDRKTLAAHKSAPKALVNAPTFLPAKRGKLPKPLDKIGGSRVQATGLIEVAEGYSVWFMWKDGETLLQSSFYGYLFFHVGPNLYPLCHFHWHPSHKPIHFKAPCDTDMNYTNRGLPGAKELNVTTPTEPYDPRQSGDRIRLIEIFCATCGIDFGERHLL
jgi:hypothetical protein